METGIDSRDLAPSHIGQMLRTTYSVYNFDKESAVITKGSIMLTIKVPQPFVKWAGGKSQLIEQIGKLLPRKFNCYFEPFVGGGALFFHLRPKVAVISDANYELINAYKVIKYDLDGLIRELDEIQARKLTPGLYESFRRIKPKSLGRAKRAARFIFLNKTCYNGLYRVNKNEEFNVPFGKYETMPRLYDHENMKHVRNLLQKAKITCSVFEIPLRNAGKGDFVYLDPPYTPDPESTGFTSYTRQAFSAADQERLAAIFRSLDKRGCLVMLSNSDTRLTWDLYRDYRGNTYELTADRMINCIGSKRTGFKELMILNYTPVRQTLAPWLAP
jgi:DNA adenine methylase